MPPGLGVKVLWNRALIFHWSPSALGLFYFPTNKNRAIFLVRCSGLYFSWNRASALEEFKIYLGTDTWAGLHYTFLAFPPQVVSSHRNNLDKILPVKLGILMIWLSSSIYGVFRPHNCLMRQELQMAKLRPRERLLFTGLVLPGVKQLMSGRAGTWHQVGPRGQNAQASSCPSYRC